MLKKHLLLAYCLFLSIAADAIYTPVTVTGYTADVVANGAAPAASSTTADVDGGPFSVFVAADYNGGSGTPTTFLPTGGLINSANTSGLTFQLASYAGNNDLRITGSNTDSFVFVTPQSAIEVFVLATTGNASSTADMTVNFTDGTSQPFTGQAIPDWFGGSGFAIQGVSRAYTNTNLIQNSTTDPRLYEIKLILAAANTGKLIRSVKITKTSAAGVLNVMGVSINTPAIPPCVAAPTAPANAGNVCAGSVTLSWPAATGATGYDVYLNTGTTATTVVATNQAATTYTATLAAGSYAWKIVPKNANGAAAGCTNFTFTVNAAVASSVTIAASPTGTICAGVPVTFTATPVNGGTAPAYQWKKGTANVGTSSATYTDNALANGDAITVVMTSNAACASPANATSNAITMSVAARPDTLVTVSGALTFCQGGSVQLSTSGAAGLTYQWQLNNANISGATASAYSPAASGDYRVVVSNSTCTDTSAARTVTIVPRPVTTVTPAGPATVCQGATTTLTATAATGVTYQWLNNNAVIAGATAQTYGATAAGSYRVVVSNGTCADTSAAVALTVNPTPGAAATAGGPLAFCQGGSVTFTASSTPSTGVTYQWLRNNAILAGATNPTYAATTSGAYRVRIVNSATGCFDTSAAITVTVSTPPSTVVNQTGTSPVCQGTTVRYTSANPGTYTFQWYLGSSPIAGATSSFYDAGVAGTYYVVVTNGTCTATSATRTLVVNPLPTVTAVATGPTAFCQGGSVVLDGGLTSGLTYQWRRNTVNIPGATSPTYTATQSGAYTLVVTNANNCSTTSAVINVTVSTPPVPVITTSGLPTFCQGNSVTLEATTGAGYTYQWLRNGNPIPGATGATFGASASGNYSVIITNGTCVATSAPFTVTVIPAPPAVITPAGPTSFCQGGSVTLNANRGTDYTYQWTRNTINIPGATSFQYTATTTGAYAVKISDGTCPAAANVVNVTVNPFPVAVITVTGGVNMSTDPFATYQWYRNGVAIAGANGQNYTAARDGFYSVVVTDAAGCSATSSVQQISALDVNAPVSGLVRIYPNPTDGLVMVETTVSTDLSITGIDGKLLLQASNTNRIDIGALPQGMYLLRIVNRQNGQLISLQKVSRR